MSYKMPEIDWSKAVVYPKIDGSLIKIYNYKGTWYISTRGTAFADSKVNGFDITFKELVFKALKVYDEDDFQTLCNDCLNKECTFIFEVTAMENRVVTRYEGYQLHYLATRHNSTGYYTNEKPYVIFGCVEHKPYKFDTAEDCLQTAKDLPNLEEGYVVYMNGIPVCKIKSPLYLAIHRLRGDNLSPKRIMELILMNEQDEYLAYFPEDSKHFLPYQKCYIQMMIDILEAYNQHMIIEDQKEFAMAVKDFPFAAILFHARKMKIGVSESFEQQTDPYKMRLLESYVKVEKE